MVGVYSQNLYILLLQTAGLPGTSTQDTGIRGTGSQKYQQSAQQEKPRAGSPPASVPRHSHD
jgi:hypothetical protein